MTLNSLDTLISDIMLSIRNSNISESESINRLQIEQWIHQYRALLIKQDIDKGRDINPQYIQFLSNLSIDTVADATNVAYTLTNRHKVDVTLPKLIDFNYKHGIVYAVDMYNNIIQVSNKNRVSLQKYRKYTGNDYLLYIDNGNELYLEGPGDLQYITLGIIAEDPSTVSGFNSSNVYPIPASMIPTLRQMILSKELNIMTNEPTDKTNNSNDDTQNIQRKSD